ncbi:scolexin B-like isoform X1 [Leptidea sinapis]|uniref:scolexin B-like isoform X1 n=1 Tax=Leptidea sinapis TaxID=189913 RepID=UPI002139D10D|nr:scolexin B-like isoform X1 [Leptidea sinapis]
MNLNVVVVLVLVVGALATPRAPAHRNQVQELTKDEALLRRLPWLWSALIADVPVSVTKVEVVPLQHDTSRPVNERYPSAVLFGGTCGGTIIDAKWILSAGHCTLFTSGREILAGTNYTDDGSGIVQRVKKLHIHPKFAVGPYWLDASEYDIKQVGARWDFLLVELQDPLPLDGKTMVAAKLDNNLQPKAHTPVGYAGFGAENHGDVMRSEMHAMDLEVLPNSECDPLEPFDPADMICTRGRAPKLDSACNGDSGSGLMHNGYVMGVASWVEDDAFVCRKGARVVFSRVAAVRDWIREVANV